MNVLSRLEAHWVVLEAELVEINKDITYSEQCVQKYGYVYASFPHATGAASNMPVHGVPGPVASMSASGSISPKQFLSVSALSVFLSRASPPATSCATPSRPLLWDCVSMLALGFSFWRRRLLLVASCSRSRTRRFVQGVLHVPAATPEGPETD